MSVNLTKPYAMSHVILAIKDDSAKGGMIVQTKRIAGHPYRNSTQKRAVEHVVNAMKNGHRIVSVVVNLITEDLSEQACKIFQPKELRELKKRTEIFATQEA